MTLWDFYQISYVKSTHRILFLAKEFFHQFIYKAKRKTTNWPQGDIVEWNLFAYRLMMPCLLLQRNAGAVLTIRQCIFIEWYHTGRCCIDSITCYVVFELENAHANVEYCCCCWGERTSISSCWSFVERMTRIPAFSCFIVR